MTIVLSIVIPCYNEENNLNELAKRFSEVINRNDIQVLLVNNGSTDNSELVLNDIVKKYNFIKVIKVNKNQGYGYGILEGLKNTEGEFIGRTHADLQTDPKDTIKALEIIEKSNFNKNLYIKGSRKNRPIFDQFFTVGMSIFETILMFKVMYEINAQPNIFHKSFFDKWDNPPYDFSLDLYSYYLAKFHKLEIKRIDVLFPDRIHGQSNWNTGLKAKRKFIKRTIGFSLELKKRLSKSM